MREKIQFKFHGRDEALNIIDTGGNLVEYLSNISNVCPLIGSEITFVKKLGKGNYGAAFLIKIKGMGKKEYVVAKVDEKKEKYKTIYVGDEKITLLDIAKNVEKKYMIPSKTFISFNGGNPKKIYPPGSHTFIYPSYAKICITSKITKYKRLDGKGEVIIPKGSYLCKYEQYSEYIIGILCGNLYRNGLSVNFLDVFGFASCPSKENLLTSQYVFMEKAGETMKTFLKNYNVKSEDTIIEVLYIQLLHAISSYQKYYKIQHNDLHMKNILLENITEESIYNNKKLHDADWFHYKVYDIDIYLPYINKIIKIADFGLSVKYSNPIIGNKRSVAIGQADNEEDIPWVPNWYSENSDAIYATDHYCVYAYKNTFVKNILGWMLGSDEKNPDLAWIDAESKKNFTSGGGRPSLKMLSGKYSRGTPMNVLQNKELMGNYLKVPEKGKIVTLGIIS